MQPMLNIAVRAARNAGNIITRAFENQDKLEADMKGQSDFVTNVDREAERAIINDIKRSYPEHTIVGEESGLVEGSDSQYRWIIDPLDGTTNFIKSIPHFSISIALQFNGKTEAAVVFDPMKSELFSAVRGKGAQLNGYRIRTGTSKDLEGTVLATAFPYRQKERLPEYLTGFEKIYPKTTDIRRMASAALDLCYVASGRVDGFWEMGLKPWDIAAGELILKEAGGMTADFSGGNSHMESGDIVAGNPKVVKALVQNLRR